MVESAALLVMVPLEPLEPLELLVTEPEVDLAEPEVDLAEPERIWLVVRETALDSEGGRIGEGKSSPSSPRYFCSSGLGVYLGHEPCVVLVTGFWLQLPGTTVVLVEQEAALPADAGHDTMALVTDLAEQNADEEDDLDVEVDVFDSSDLVLLALLFSSLFDGSGVGCPSLPMVTVGKLGIGGLGGGG